MLPFTAKPLITSLQSCTPLLAQKFCTPLCAVPPLGTRNADPDSWMAFLVRCTPRLGKMCLSTLFLLPAWMFCVVIVKKQQELARRQAASPLVKQKVAQTVDVLRTLRAVFYRSCKYRHLYFTNREGILYPLPTFALRRWFQAVHFTWQKPLKAGSVSIPFPPPSLPLCCPWDTSHLEGVISSMLQALCKEPS